MHTVRYFAGARAAAGVPAEDISAPTLRALIDTLTARHGAPLGRVLAVASYLVDEVSWRDRDAALPDSATVDVLPPFAGG